MIPIGDENPTLRTPVVTLGLLTLLVGVWLFAQGGGLNARALSETICQWGMVPGALAGRLGLDGGLPAVSACSGYGATRGLVTLVSSMFLHGSWSHLVGNALFLWVFGKNVEDSMGRLAFAAFYLICGLTAAGLQIVGHRSSGVPMVGASGAISGVLGAYLLLYPRVRVRVLFFLLVFVRVLALPAYVLLVWWIGWQIIAGLPHGETGPTEASSGVAIWAHIGGFAAGLALVKLFADRRRVQERTWLRHWLHPGHP